MSRLIGSHYSEDVKSDISEYGAESVPHAPRTVSPRPTFLQNLTMEAMRQKVKRLQPVNHGGPGMFLN